MGVIKNAKPVQIGDYQVGILDRSSRYWKAQGRTVWGETVRSFKIRLLATGAFAIGAVLLEAWDIYDDHQHAATKNEKIVTRIKGLAVALMGLGGGLQIHAVVKTSSVMASIAMGPWFAVGMLAAGALTLQLRCCSTISNRTTSDHGLENAPGPTHLNTASRYTRRSERRKTSITGNPAQPADHGQKHGNVPA